MKRLVISSIIIITFLSGLSASCPRRINATFPPVTSSQSNYADFNAYVLPQPNVTGVTVLVAWNNIESNTVPGSYNFSAWDANLMHFSAAGKEVNLIIAPVGEGKSNRCTPTYVFSAGWAATVNTPNPQDVVYCPYYPGSGVLVNTCANINTPNFDNTGFPVSYETPFKEAYKRFIAAVIQHYSTPGPSVPKIGYIRFGMSAGGEAVALCHANWPGYSENAYLNYIKEMMIYIASLKPTIKMLADLNQVSNDISYCDAEAQYAVQFGNMGFGTNGLQQSDIVTNPVGTSDWINMFDLYKNNVINGDTITLSLQTLLTSDPTGSLATGSLAILLPFAKQHGVNNLELYTCDLLLAFDPNYNNTTCKLQNQDYISYSSDYVKAINDFMSGCTIKPTAAENNTMSDNKISVISNLGSSELIINTGNQTLKNTQVFSISGKLICTSYTTKISLVNLQKGFYLLTVNTDKNNQVFKFIKN